MRTIQLTHQEMETLIRALAIAERAIEQTRTQVLNSLITVRFNADLDAPHKELLDKVTDLLLDINSGGKDV